MSGWKFPAVLGQNNNCYITFGGLACKTQPQYPGALGVCTAERISLNVAVVSSYDTKQGAAHRLLISQNNSSLKHTIPYVSSDTATNNLTHLDYTFPSGMYQICVQSTRLNTSTYSTRNQALVEKGITQLVQLQTGYTNYINFKISRKQSIIYDIFVPFKLKANSAAIGEAPWYEWKAMSQVAENKTTIEAEAKKQGVDADLVKAIIFMETTHGYYDNLVAPFDQNSSILPMNIRSGYWKDLGYSREELKDPQLNIEAGVYLIKKIVERASPRNIETYASLYQNLGTTNVTEYGQRVANIYQNKLWLPTPKTPGFIESMQSEIQRYDNMDPLQQVQFLSRLFGG